MESGAGEEGRLPHPTLKSLSQLINNYVMVALIWPLDGASVCFIPYKCKSGYTS